MELGRIPIFEGKVENDRADDDSDGTCVLVGIAVFGICVRMHRQSRHGPPGGIREERRRQWTSEVGPNWMLLDWEERDGAVSIRPNDRILSLFKDIQV